MKTTEERIAELEARLAQAETRIAQLEARQHLPSIPMNPQPWFPQQPPPFEVWCGTPIGKLCGITPHSHPAPHAAQAMVASPGGSLAIGF